MKITVITACWNAERWISDCIQSVANQTHPDVEHWIIDGGSTDRTLELVEANRHPGMKMVSGKDGGIYQALNRGLELATGEVIGFLNADDFFESDDVLSAVASTMSDPANDGCYADLVYVQENDTTKVVRYWKADPFQPGAFLKGWMPPHPTFYARAGVYEKVGGFNTGLAIGSDWEFLMRFFEIEKLTAEYVPKTWVRMRLGGVSNRSFRNVLKNNLDTWRVCRLVFGPFRSLQFPVRKFLHRIRQFNRKPEEG